MVHFYVKTLSQLVRGGRGWSFSGYLKKSIFWSFVHLGGQEWSIDKQKNIGMHKHAGTNFEKSC